MGARKKKASGSKSENVLTPEQLRKFIRAHGATYLEDPNVTSIGIGRDSDGDPTAGPLCIQFTVATKSDDASVLEDLGTQVLPSSITIEGVEIPTDVIERSYRAGLRVLEVSHKSERKQRIDPLQPGVSISHPDGTAGTLGAIVYDRADGASCALSNWHVLHGSTGFIGDPVVQPGPADDNDVDRNGSGFLRRSHLGAAGDCAIATIDERGIDRDVFELETSIGRIGEPELNDLVVKSGRTTGVTFGRVRRVDVMAKINYGSSVGDVAIGCFEIGPDPENVLSYGDEVPSCRPGQPGVLRLTVFGGILAGNHLRIDIGLHLVQLGHLLTVGRRNALPIVEGAVAVAHLGFADDDPRIVMTEDPRIFLVAGRIG